MVRQALLATMGCHTSLADCVTSSMQEYADLQPPAHRVEPKATVTPSALIADL
jgi:hypothetical protein